MKTMGAAKFKAECLAVIDEIQLRNEPVMITKKGKPTVIVSPVPSSGDTLAMYKFGGGQIVQDLLSPGNNESDWEYD